MDGGKTGQRTRKEEPGYRRQGEKILRKKARRTAQRRSLTLSAGPVPTHHLHAASSQQSQSSFLYFNDEGNKAQRGIISH